MTSKGPGPLGVWLRRSFLLYVTLLVGLPVVALVATALRDGLGATAAAITDPVALAALRFSFFSAAITAVLNGVMGVATAWVLVRYPLPGKRWLSALVDLPVAIPTLVAGVILVILYGPQSAAGAWLDRLGLPVAYAPPGVILALLFVTLPFVVRSVEPVLEELDPAEEEAAMTLGASRAVTFGKVVLPALLPAALTGVLQCFARCLSEFGAVVILSGNIPFSTLTASVHLFGEIEGGRASAAASVALVLVGTALTLQPIGRWLEAWVGVKR